MCLQQIWDGLSIGKIIPDLSFGNGSKKREVSAENKQDVGVGLPVEVFLSAMAAPVAVKLVFHNKLENSRSYGNDNGYQQTTNRKSASDLGLKVCNPQE